MPVELLNDCNVRYKHEIDADAVDNDAEDVLLPAVDGAALNTSATIRQHLQARKDKCRDESFSTHSILATFIFRSPS
jgi:hypothetical protein